jgi:transcriptional regulator with XRE-family HTH domain
MGIQVVDNTLTKRLAERLKLLRQERGWSLGRLAELSGVSRATLSRLENAEVSPTTEVLGKLCAAYALTLSRLLAQVEDSFKPVVRRAEQTLWTDPESSFLRRSVSPPASALKAEVLACELKAGTRISYDAPPVAGLEHHLVLLEGYLEITVDGDRHQLHPGDCVRYQLFGGSEFRTTQDRIARYMLVLV